jgi:hypothetical protein
MYDVRKKAQMFNLRFFLFNQPLFVHCTSEKPFSYLENVFGFLNFCIIAIEINLDIQKSKNFCADLD